MLNFNFKKNNKYHIVKASQNKGFTLIELLVSIALFSIVVVVVLGSIMTIIDSNKKARTLMTVMNNLNFSVDSITRSFKTGRNPYGIESGSNSFRTDEIDYDNYTSSSDFSTRQVEYFITTDSDGIGMITKNGERITSPDIDIDVNNSSFVVKHYNSPQPYLIILLSGEAKITDRIKSDFKIQTSVSQRKLEPGS